MKKYKTKLSDHNAKEVVLWIEHVLVMAPILSISQAVSFAVLEEVRIAISKKTVEYKKEYSFSFTPAQALSISYMYTEFINGNNHDQAVNRIMQMSNEIIQLYSL